MPHMGSYLPCQGLNLCPLHWKHGVLTPGPPGKSLTDCLLYARHCPWHLTIVSSLVSQDNLMLLVFMSPPLNREGGLPIRRSEERDWAISSCSAASVGGSSWNSPMGSLWRSSFPSRRLGKACAYDQAIKKGRGWDFPGGPAVKTLCSQCRGPRFNPWSGN